jgi:hypothetical protein
MNKQEAKATSLEVWRYLATHPEIRDKNDLPEELLCKIRRLRSRCPLCELFKASREFCPGCPLDDVNCMWAGSPYDKWCYAGSPEKRRNAAESIVRRIENWEVEAA